MGKLKCGINRADLENLNGFTYLPEKKARELKERSSVRWKISPIHSLSFLQACRSVNSVAGFPVPAEEGTEISDSCLTALYYEAHLQFFLFFFL